MPIIGSRYQWTFSDRLFAMDYLWQLFVHLFITASVCSRQGKAADWSYGGNSGHGGGSEVWSAKYPKCGGTQQSPIDLRPATAKYAEGKIPFVMSGYSNELRMPPNHTFTLTNTGYTVQLNVNTSSISISGGGLNSRYILAQIHMHWGDVYATGSEHTVNGWSYPLEIHFVHFKADSDNLTVALTKPDGLAVLGVFAQVNQVAFRHEGIENIVSNLKDVAYRDAVREIDRFELSSLLPTNTDEFYRYRGSLTTPPCYESVIWTVFRQPINISGIQLAKFRLLDTYGRPSNISEPIVNNYRPVQPLNGRSVVRTFPIASTKPEVSDQCSTGGSAANH